MEEMIEKYGSEDLAKIFDLIMEHLERVDKVRVYDRISTPIGNYMIETEPVIFTSNDYVTKISVSTKTNKLFGPIPVAIVHSEEESLKEHYDWRTLILECSPTVIKNYLSDEIITIEP